MINHSNLLSRVKGIDHAFLNYQQSIYFSANIIFTSIKQVNGSEVWIFDDNIVKDPAKEIQSDAIICHSKETTISIITADCIPLLIASLDAEIIAVVHAGWKGLSQGIIKNTIEKINSLNTSESELFFCIGPHIMPCCYEIKKDLIESVKKTSSNKVDISLFTEIKGSDSIYLNLADWCKYLLMSEGVNPLNIESINHCTYCSAHGYGSYRRRTHHAEKKSFQYSWIKKIPAEMFSV